MRFFVLFVGYPRSGHSIVASLLDAHPNVVIAQEVFKWIREANLNFSKSQLFTELFKKVTTTEVGAVTTRDTT